MLKISGVHVGDRELPAGGWAQPLRDCHHIVVVELNTDDRLENFAIVKGMQLAATLQRTDLNRRIGRVDMSGQIEIINRVTTPCPVA